MSNKKIKDRAVEELKNGKPAAYSATKEYFETFVDSLDKLRVSSGADPRSSDVTAEHILAIFKSFELYRNECLEVIDAIAIYSSDARYMKLVHNLFESIQKYLYPPEKKDEPRVVVSPSEYEYGVFHFFSHDLFLHSGAKFISYERFDFFKFLVDNLYYYEKRDGRENPAASFTIFNGSCELLEIYKGKAGTSISSPFSYMLRLLTDSSSVDFEDVLQTDFILLLRGKCNDNDMFKYWWPAKTLAYSTYRHSAFKIFEKSRSKQYFEKIKPMLNITEKEDLIKLMDACAGTLKDIDGFAINQNEFVNIDNLCTFP